MHSERLKRGEIQEGEPLRIVDIGGANGVLGKLITDLAKENGMDIDYQIVDPDAPTVRSSKEFYSKNSSLSFKEQTGIQFNHELHTGNPEISTLVEQRQKLIDDGERKLADLDRVILDIEHQHTQSRLDEGKMGVYRRILQSDFGITLPDSAMEDSDTFRDYLDRDYSVFPSIVFRDKYRKILNEPIFELTKQIDQLLANQPAKFDLVINSWMPVRMDLSKDVREANGAAILYVVEQYGATGCRSDALFPESPKQLGEEESYNPGVGYESRYGWVGHSTPQARNMLRSREKDLLESHDSNVRPFSNGYIMQSKRGYASIAVASNPLHQGIEVKGHYPWERELTEKGGEISHTIPHHDEDGILDYISPFNQLTDDLIRIAQTQKKDGIKPLM